MSTTLDTVITRHALARVGAPPSRAKGVVLLIHGRGATAESMLPLADVVAMPDLCYLAPQAEGYTWYPQSFMAPTAANEPYLSRALDRVAAIIADILDAGITPEKLAVVGFSQGACLALESFARDGAGLAGVFGMSGGLVGLRDASGGPQPALYGHAPKRLDYPGRRDGAQVWISVHQRDPHIPLQRVQDSAAALTAMGATVETRIYPGEGHGVMQDDLAALRARING